MIGLLLAVSLTTDAARISDAQQKAALYGFIYNVQPSVILNVLRCESYYGKYNYNPNEVHGASHGAAQFRQSTFDHYSKKAGIKNGSPYNNDDAIRTMSYMISIGKGKHFSCYTKNPL